MDGRYPNNGHQQPNIYIHSTILSHRKVALLAVATLSQTMASAFTPKYYAPKPRLLSTALGGATNTDNNERRSKASQQLEGTIIAGGGISSPLQRCNPLHASIAYAWSKGWEKNHFATGGPGLERSWV